MDNIKNIERKPNLDELLIELLDLIYIPSSMLRFAHKRKKLGDFKPKDKYKNSRFWQVECEIYPYLSTSFLEVFRLYGYYQIYSLIK